MVDVILIVGLFYCVDALSAVVRDRGSIMVIVPMGLSAPCGLMIRQWSSGGLPSSVLSFGGLLTVLVLMTYLLRWRPFLLRRSTRNAPSSPAGRDVFRISQRQIEILDRVLGTVIALMVLAGIFASATGNALPLAMSVLVFIAIVVRARAI